MSNRLRLRLIGGLAYVLLAIVVLTQAPITGVALLLLPTLWTVLVIWMGSEKDVGFGPYRRSRDTAFAYVLRQFWKSGTLVKAVTSLVGAILIVGGLGWISTENLRHEANSPTLSERAATTAESATEATKKTARGWIDTAKGWFRGSETDHSP